jgi:hypothetical protein
MDIQDKPAPSGAEKKGLKQLKEFREKTAKIIRDGRFQKKFREKTNHTPKIEAVDEELAVENASRILQGKEEVSISGSKADHLLGVADKGILKDAYKRIKKQKSFDEDKKVRGFQILSEEEKKKLSIIRLKSLRDERPAGLIHYDDEFNLHPETGKIIFENRLAYVSGGEEYLKIIKGRRRMFHKDGSYETVYLCNEFLPFTLEKPFEEYVFPHEFRNLMLDVCHSIKLLSKEWLSREIAGIVKTTQRVLIAVALTAFLFGIITGMVFIR